MKPNSINQNLRTNHRIRQDLRIPASILVDVNFDNTRSIFGRLEDLSLNGAKLRLPISTAIGSELTLTFPIHQLTLKGTCRWSLTENWSVNSYLSGINFNNLNPEQYAQLRRLLFSLAG